MLPMIFGIVILVGLAWLTQFDTPDRNPFLVADLYRFLVAMMAVVIILLCYKTVVWNRDLRALILQTCQ